MEKRLQSILERTLRMQRLDFRRIRERKQVQPWLNKWIRIVTNKSVQFIRNTIEIGWNIEIDIGKAFDVKSPMPYKYLEQWSIRELSQAQGSISLTTKTRIEDAIRAGEKLGKTIQQVADDIENIDPFIFSPARAKLIAKTEIYRAYEFGKYTKALEATALYTVGKEWVTVHDSHVRTTHTKNSADGVIHIDQAFSGTGDIVAPASDFGCRCSIAYTYT